LLSAKDEAQPFPWKAPARYEIRRCIGRGGMGVVYEAYDRERRRLVAIKTLQRFSPSALYLFKREFRTLANVLHPNLVELHDLVASDSEGFYFTMELVRGQDFRSYVHRPDAPGVARQTPRQTSVRVPRRSGDLTPADRDLHPDLLEAFASPHTPATTPADLERLRAAMRQLAEGVHALHAAGKLHRDIKPSNVLVSEGGRVVLLDFGVATELSSAGLDPLLEPDRVGTPEYMAPEQAFDEPLTAAADWYSVGALLYDALVGRPPFAGDPADVLHRKRMLDPPAPSDLVEGVPADLDALCRDLLRRAPDERPAEEEILLRVGAPVIPGPRVPSVAPAGDRGRLIGREGELRVLRTAFDDVRAGRALVVRVRGGSGMGKSTLVQCFLDDLVSRGEAVALSGRAYERESVAYNAVDGIVDALSRYLVALEHRNERVALPSDAWAMARLFPVLLRVEAIASQRAGSTADPHLVRQRGFVALRELLSELGRLRPIVLHVDDVQWGDLDSATLLLETLHGPRAPPVLVIMGYREGGKESVESPFLDRLRGRAFGGLEQREIALGPLALEDARALALDLMAASGEVAERVADAIARAAGGSAFFVEDLARSVRAHGMPADTSGFVIDGGSSVERVIANRVAGLGDAARRVLELVAVHGRPVLTSVLREAAGLVEGLDPLVRDLRAQHLVRVEAKDGREVVDTSHARIREAVAGRLCESAARARHRRLAEAYESADPIEAEAMMWHWFGAGEAARGATYAQKAAERALEKLAFDQAVHLHRLALGALEPLSADAQRVRVRLADALTWAGCAAEAAQLYLDAASRAAHEERTALERAGANRLLLSGQIDEGSRVLRHVLAQAGRPAPRSRWAAFLWLAVYLVRLRFMRLRFAERAHDSTPAPIRGEMEALYAAVVGVGFVDPIVGATLLARLLILALRSGSLTGVAAATGLAATELAARGGPETERERRLARMGKELILRIPSSSGAADFTDAVLDRPLQAIEALRAFRLFLRGQWKDAHATCEAAFATLPAASGNWNAHALGFYGEFALVFLGEFAELAGRLPGLLADAERRGDRLTLVNLRTGIAPAVCLAGDDPRGARAHVLESVAEWSQRGFLLQHWRAMIAEVDVDLYEGQATRAAERLARDAGAFRRSFLWLPQHVRSIHSFARARVDVASSLQPPGSRRRLRQARALARRLEREGLLWTSALAALVRASLADADGDPHGACRYLREAAERAHGADMALYGYAAEHRLGTLLGGDEGTTLVGRVEDAMRAKGVQAPRRYVAMLLPGRWLASAASRSGADPVS